MTSLYLIRHAECAHNLRRDYIWGRSNDSPLTPRGKRQALALEARLRAEGVVFDALYSSPAVRAWETIVRAAPHYPRDKIIIAPELQELDQGAWTGKSRADIYTSQQLAIINADNWYFTPPGGESQADVAGRAYNLVDEAIVSNLAPPQNIGFATHGVAIKCLLTRLFNSDVAMAWRWQIDNASITELRHEQGRWWPVRINDAAHIQGL